MLGSGTHPTRTQAWTISNLNMSLTLTVVLLVWSSVAVHIGNCSKSSEEVDIDTQELSETHVGDKNASSACELIYQDYLNVIKNFTHCELQYARPFRLCLACADQFELAKAMFWNLTEEPRHVDCKVKYMQSDRVQVIPTVQSDMEGLWNKAHCQNCYLYEPDQLGTKKVSYRPDVEKFMELYENFTDCLNTTEDFPESVGNASATCATCNSSYALLTNHYNSMYSASSGDVCMDLTDRMNITRIMWTLQLKCTHRHGDHDLLAVVTITCVVACTPIFFYVSLRITSKVGRKKIFKQKRLGTGSGTTSESGEHCPGAGGDSSVSKRRHTTAD